MNFTKTILNGLKFWTENNFAKQTDIPNTSMFVTKAVADLENYYKKSETYTQSEIDEKIAVIQKFEIKIIASLPSENISETTVYLLPGGESGNLYTEYIYVNGEWEILGSQRIDLTGYATETWVTNKLKDYALESEALKIDNLATDEEILAMMLEMDALPTLVDADGDVLIGADNTILLI